MTSFARLSALILCMGSVGAMAQTVADASLQPRKAASSACVPSGDAKWLTPGEKSCYATTPDYDDTMAYLRRVEAAAPGQVKIEGFGTTGEGRELDIVIASRDGVFDPAAIHAAKRPIVLVQNSIHAGEMDGKDACLALLRDMVINKTKAALLDRAVFVFIPMYNADGHERRSAYNRINQDGPAEMGWRGNGTNLNLNRDYLKADAPETRAFMAMYHHWLPDFFVDDHVTDGADYQYDVTFTIDDGPNLPAATVKWVDDVANPTLEKYVDAHGHLAFPNYINLVNDNDPAQGLGFNDDPPRFSTGYMVLEGRPGMLVELHMLKDYKTRVTGNYEILAGLMELMNRDADKVIALNAAADQQAEGLGAHPLSDTKFPLALGWGGQTTPVLFHGYKYTKELSAVSGAMWVKYSHEPWNVSLPIQAGFKVTAEAAPPAAYIIPAQWTDVIGVLAAHQVEMKRTAKEWAGEVETYQCAGMAWQEPPFEGRHPTFNGEAAHDPGKFGSCVLIRQKMSFPAGSAVVRLNQRLSKVVMEWLEPAAPDSALQWGFFDTIFEQKEYGEAYVLESLAREMMAKDPKLKEEFEKKVSSDPVFAGNANARLEFFYERSPWFAANRVGLYPVGRLDDVQQLGELK
ncbi:MULTISPECIES: M14 family metallopeptidase [Acidobacteriaceae]|uniref:M14 family metallopeptidase n=1 Tax=Acidobacteriaceae TaxID=204434 RepID=UPI0020B121D1|nr:MULTISPECIES: M14 family metallopeptidase [Acidobacteriaceae]MDW5264228.1 M14 family metallopeptidase [Edaphobacter sp.]